MKNKYGNKPINIGREIFFSDAWGNLSATAMRAYMIFQCKLVKIQAGKNRKGKQGREDRTWEIANNGQLVFTYAEAEKDHRICHSTFARAIGELVNHGLIDVTGPGCGAHSGKEKMPTHYAISERWRDWGTEKFKAAERTKTWNRGFAMGNDHWKKSKASATNAHNDMRTNAHIPYLVMLTNAHNGEIIKKQYKFIGGQWLSENVA